MINLNDPNYFKRTIKIFMMAIIIFLIAFILSMIFSSSLKTKHIAIISTIEWGMDDMTIMIPLLKLRCIANAKTIPMITLVEIIFRKYKKGMGIIENTSIWKGTLIALFKM